MKKQALESRNHDNIANGLWFCMHNHTHKANGTMVAKFNVILHLDLSQYWFDRALVHPIFYDFLLHKIKYGERFHIFHLICDDIYWISLDLNPPIVK